MKDFVVLEKRLNNLLAGLDGDLWKNMMAQADPPKTLPDEQEVLDMVFRDSKAVSGYIPDLMAIMRNHVPAELDADNHSALAGIIGLMNVMTRILLMVLLVPRYRDHEDLITTFNGYRQSLVFATKYLAQVETK